MISGEVSVDRTPIIRLMIRALDGTDREIELIVDTGYNGWISLPATLVSELELPWRRRGRGELADASETIFDIYEATIVWDGDLRRVWIDEIDAILLAGMALLDGHELFIEAWHGGTVRITARD